MDVDLRQLSAVVGKKRSSIDSPERNSKKSKAEVFDRYKTALGRNKENLDAVFNSRLFGDEDTDLRQLSLGTDKPSPIRHKLSPKNVDQHSPVHNDTELINVNVKSPDVTIIENDRPPTPPPPIISSCRDSPQRNENSRKSFDAVRAKLANATFRNKNKQCKYRYFKRNALYNINISINQFKTIHFCYSDKKK